MTIQQPAMLRGARVDHRYELYDVVGRGAMGAVYRAFDHQRSEEVALKVLDAGAFGEAASEFGSAARLSHPNLVPLYDVGITGDQAYFAMALVSGTPCSGTAMDWDPASIARVGHQLFSAIALLEQHGVCHADIKPDNLLLTSSAPVHVIVVDLAVQPVNTGPPRGTPAYLAPEVARGHSPNVFSDQYSAGVLLAELAMGHNPFEGETLQETLTLHQRADRTYLAELPGDLRQIIVRLTNPDPEQRYTSAAEVARAFESLQHDGLVGRTCVVNQSTLVGRDDWLVAADTMLDQVTSDAAGGSLAIYGAQGSGRSRFIEEVAIRARTRGVRVVTVRQCSGPVMGQLQSLPWLSDAVRDRCAGVDGDATTEVPVLVTLDDAVSGPIVNALVQLARDTSGLAVLLASDTPTDEGGDELTSLTPAFSSQLLSSMLGGPVDDAVLNLPLHERTGGNPGALVEWVHALADARILVQRAGTWTLTSGRSLSDARPKGVVARLAQLPPDEREVLSALIIWGRSTNASTLAALTLRTESLVQRSLRVLEDERWVKTIDDRFTTNVSPADVQPTSPRWAALSRQALKRSTDDDPGQTMRWHAWSGDTTSAFVVGRASAEAALEQGRRAEALETIEFLNAQGSDDGNPNRAWSESTAGRLTMELGRYADAEALLQAAVERDPSVENLRTLAETLVRLGRTDEAMAMSDEMLASATSADRPDRLFVGAALIAQIAGKVERARQILADAPVSVDDRAQAERHLVSATIEWQQGRLDSAEAEALAARTLFETFGAAEKHAHATMQLGTIARKRGEFEAAIVWYEGAIASYQATGSLGAIGKCRNNIAVCLYCLGRWKQAADDWDEAIRITELTGEVAETVVLQNNVGFTCMERGWNQRAEGAYSRALELADERNLDRLGVIVRGNLGELRFRQRQFEEAEDLLRASIETADRLDARGDGLENRRRLAQCALEAGDPDEAIRRAKNGLARLGEESSVERHRFERVVAEAQLQLGDVDAAVATLNAADAAPEALDSGWLELLWARIELVRTRVREAEKRVERAIQIFKDGDVDGWHTDRAEILRAEITEANRRMPASGSLGRFMSDLGTAGDRHAACVRGLEMLLTVLKAERCILFMPAAAHRDEIRIQQTSKNVAEADFDSFSQTVAQRTLTRGEPVCLSNVANDEQIGSAASVAALDMRSVICVPVVEPGGPTGLLYVDSRTWRPDWNDQLDTAALVGQGLGLALSRLFEQDNLATQHRLMAMVAHDLRNALQLTVGYAEMALAEHEDEPLPEIGLELAQVTLDQSQQVLRLTEDLLSYGRELSVVVSAATRVDVGDILTRMATSAAPMAIDQMVTIATEIDGEIDVLPCDSDRIQQVVGNLIRNAIQYTVLGSRVTLKLARQPHNGMLCERESVRISVTDQGPGVSEEDAASIFSAFVRGTSASGKGAGLGLSIARHIVQAHGGRIWVESEIGAGSTFHFTIPVELL